MSSDLIKAIAAVRRLKQQRSDVAPSKLGQWAMDYSAATWGAITLFVQEVLGGE